MNRKLSYRNWQFLSQQLGLSLKISFWESSFVEICSKINRQVSLHRSIRLIWKNRKLMNRKSMNRKSSYRNWKRKLSWMNLKFGNFRRPILFLVSFDLFAVPTFWFFHFVREQHFLLHPILLLQLVLKLPNVFFYVIWMFWDLEEFLKIVFDVLIGIKNKLSYEIVLESQKFKFDFIKSLAHCGLLWSILTGAIKSTGLIFFWINLLNVLYL